MESSERVKSLNTDPRGKNRIRFRSAKQRAKRASADVYRSYNGRNGRTSSREEQVHNPHHSTKKRRRLAGKTSLASETTATTTRQEDQESGPERTRIAELEDETTFASELDLANDRNGSEIFTKFYHEIWPLVRSLPEILHHASKIVQILLKYLLSCDDESNDDNDENDKKKTSNRYVVNHATTDVLHLLAVLARDLRHEIHPFVFTSILPRIVNNLINPPPPPSGKQSVPLDVAVVEAAFRTLSYVFKYDADFLVTPTGLESLRKQCYGPTLGHRRELVRRLAAESYAPLLRRLKSDGLRQKHLKRILKALAASEAASASAARQQAAISRSQADAMDGISWLLLETVRGTRGRLHSKAQNVLQNAIHFPTGHGQTIAGTIQALVAKLCQHLDVTGFAPLWKVLLVPNSEETDQVHHRIALVQQAVEARNGYFLKTQDTEQSAEEAVGLLLNLLKDMLATPTFDALTDKAQTGVIHLLCAAWRTLPNRMDFPDQLGHALQSLLRQKDNGTKRAKLAFILCDRLVPFLPVDIAMKHIGSVVLDVAAATAPTDAPKAVEILFSIVNCREESRDETDNDDTFDLNHARDFPVSKETLNSLLDLCLADDWTSDETRNFAEIGYAVRCIPFLAANAATDQKLRKRILRWSIKGLQTITTQDNTNEIGSAKDNRGRVVTKALILEASSMVMDEALRTQTGTEWLKKMAAKFAPMALEFLLCCRSSLWAVKAVARFVRTLATLNLRLTEDANALLDALVPNLARPSHFLRLHTLQILTCLPKKPFEVDHASLDLRDDLDEEQDAAPQGASEARGLSDSFSGLCDILDSLLRVESIQPSLENERQATALISRVEILGRTGRMPVPYAEAAANHMIGILSVKFAPLWDAAVRALVAIAKSHEEIVWIPLNKTLRNLLSQSQPDAKEITRLEEEPSQSRSSASLQDLCIAWDTTEGRDVSLFQRQINNAKEIGRVSRHSTTDCETVLTNIFAALESVPEITCKKSKVVVPLFFEYLRHQYFTFHSLDPERRELMIEKQVGSESNLRTGTLPRGVLHGRLLSFLKVFGAIKGPHQLHKHDKLRLVFIGFLSHPETRIAHAAFSCLLRFKFPFVAPYEEYITALFKNNSFRESMMRFDVSREAEIIHSDHRAPLLTLLTRIMIGRLRARQSMGKKLKDSAASRREAVLAFLSRMDKEELYSLVYLMVRTYIPGDTALRPVEEYAKSDQQSILKKLEVIQWNLLAAIPDQRHEGFLNLFGSVISQLSYSVLEYLPAFLEVLFAVTRFSAVSGERESTAGAIMEGDDDSGDEADVSANNGRSRKSVIRSLCHRRLNDVMSLFGDSFDFGPYVQVLWKGLAESVKLLPRIAGSCTKPPVLLDLLVTISSHSRLRRLLAGQDFVIQSVVGTIHSDSDDSVVEHSLTFVDNLLSLRQEPGNENSSKGHEDDEIFNLMLAHVPVLLRQFTARFSGKQPENRAQKFRTRGSTWKELDVLCKVGQVMVEERRFGENISTDMLRVCEELVQLLVPLLTHSRGTENDKRNILRVLHVLIPNVDAAVAQDQFSSISDCLAPQNNRSSLHFRKSVVDVICALASCKGVDEALSKVGSVLEKLCAVHKKRVDEFDHDKILPALGDLGAEDGAGWLRMVDEGSGSGAHVSFLRPVLHCCFFFLQIDDGVLNRASFKALRALVTLASKRQADNQWVKVVEGLIVPSTRKGLGNKSEPTRRHFILLLSHVAACFKDSKSPNLYGDLHLLFDRDDHDQDFFLNITHLQIHRRGRALHRLRKILNDGSNTEAPFSNHSLSNILLPMATHPIYESERNSEKSHVLECIATVGAIARHLTWSKYHTLLWTTLNQFHRHPNQEQYLISMICSILDAFHFEVCGNTADTVEDPAQQTNEQNAVGRALENRLIPQTERLLVKEKKDKDGTKLKTIRPSVVLALLKLFNRISRDTVSKKLPRLLATICDALKSYDSDTRDTARSTLSKMVAELEPREVYSVVEHLKVALTEGYKLHVRMATVHSILLALAEQLNGQIEGKFRDRQALDLCWPVVMEIVMDDLFGSMREQRETEGIKRKYIKEAGGSKSTDALEIIARLLHFEPERVVEAGKSSSVHVVVGPFLDKLNAGDVAPSTISKIRECLNRVAVGLSRNPTVTPEAALPFIYACIRPAVGDRLVDSVVAVLDEGDSDESDDESPIQVSKSNGGDLRQTSRPGQSDMKKSAKVVEWRPSHHKVAKNAAEARLLQKRQQKADKVVKDGASAPKLTGSGRFEAVSSSSVTALNDPASTAGILFGLTLLISTLKRTGGGDKLLSRKEPFVPLLTSCVCYSRNNDVVLLSLRGLGFLLRTDLPSVPQCSNSLSAKILDILGSGGTAGDLNSDLTQSCFKTLAFLIQSHKIEQAEDTKEEQKDEQFLLDDGQMQILLAILKASILESDHHNHCISLIKAIVARRFVSAELYDLMETLLRVSVQSHKDTLRQQCSMVFMQYLINYPMGKERLGSHLRQLVRNLQYEYQDGRLSSIGLVSAAVEKFPTELLDEHAQLFYLPLVLRLANDDSKLCREGAAKCLSRLLARVSTPVVLSMYEYTLRWSKGGKDLQRTALQLFGIFVDANLEFFNQNKKAADLVEHIAQHGFGAESSSSSSSWEMPYFSLLCLEKLSKHYPSLLLAGGDRAVELWDGIVESFGHNHPWVQLASSRLFATVVSSTLDPCKMDPSDDSFFLVVKKGRLFDIARGLCRQIAMNESYDDHGYDNHEDDDKDKTNDKDEFVTMVIRNLVWVAKAMHYHPGLCFGQESGDDHNDDDDNDDAAPSRGERKPLRWLMTRLSQMAKPKIVRRRMAVFRCLAAFCHTNRGGVLLRPYLQLWIEALQRSILESEGLQRDFLNPRHAGPRQDSWRSKQHVDKEKETLLAREVLQMLQDCSDHNDTDESLSFVEEYARVQRRFQQRREKRKQELATESIQNPAAAAARKIRKHQKERQRRKRRVQDHRRHRGGPHKRQRSAD